MQVQRVDMAPLALRRTALLQVGGFDETLSEPGMCGIVSDWDLSQRMWVAGWAVMATGEALPMVGDDHPGGTHTTAAGFKCW